MLNVSYAAKENTTEILINSIINSFLGPNKSLKQVVNDAESFLVGCPLSVFQAVSPMNPFGHLIQETLFAHHEHYECGTLTLLAMWYFWNREFKKLMEKGYQLTTIISTAEESLQHVISVLPTIEIPIQKLLYFLDDKFPNRNQPVNPNRLGNLSIKKCSNASTYSQPTRGKQFVATQILNFCGKHFSGSIKGIPQGIAMKSRHFSPALSCQEEQFESRICYSNPQVSSGLKSTETLMLSEENSNHLHTIVKQLSHCTFEVADVLAKTWESQISEQRKPRFHLDFISICPVVGTCFYNTVVDGVLIKTKLCQNIEINNKEHTALLISGDVTASYMHLGFSPTVCIESKKSGEELSTSKWHTWFNDCTQLLLKLQISLILVRGSVDQAIMDFCESHSIIVINDISLKTFKVLCKVSDGSAAPYLLQCDKENIVSNISIQNYLLEMASTDAFCYILVKIKKITQTPVKPQTVILCHPCQSVLDLRKHQFWHVASRLALATKAAVLLPGGGETEKWCSQVLYSLHSTKQGSEISKAIADGFLCFWETVLKKFQLTDMDKALDEKESKIQAWKSALALLLVSLQADFVLINGCDKVIYENLGKSNLFIGSL